MPDIARTRLAPASPRQEQNMMVPDGDAFKLRARLMPAIEPGDEIVDAWWTRPLTVPAKIRKSNWLISLLGFVVLPSVIAALYLGCIASPRYTSEYRVAIRSAGSSPANGLALAMGLSGLPGASQAANDSYAIVQYLQSHEAISDMEKSVPLHAMYEANSIDWFSRLKPGEPSERVVKYWRGMLNAYYEMSTGTIVVAVTAFTPQDTINIAKKALSLSEQLVNRMSERMRDDTVAVAEAEVRRSEARLHAATDQVRAAQDKFSVIDPKQTADTTLSQTARLQDEIARLKSEIDVQSGYLSPTSPTLKIKIEQLQSLQGQLDGLKSQVTGSIPTKKGQETLSGVISAFSHLQSEQMFAEKAYQSALAALDSARVEALRQQSYLETIVRPGMPQQQSFPMFFLNMAEVIGLALTIWAIGFFAVHSIREHMG